MSDYDVIQAIGGLLEEARMARAVHEDTRLILIRISDQNADILAQLRSSNERHRESERRIAAVENKIEEHADRLAAIEARTAQ